MSQLAVHGPMETGIQSNRSELVGNNLAKNSQEEK